MTSSSATRLRAAVGVGSLLLTLTLGSSAAAMDGPVGLAGSDTGDATEIGGISETGDATSVGDTPTGDEPDARLVVWREAPTAVQSRCAAEGSDEVSSYRLPDVMGVSYRVGDREVSGTVEVSDGDQVTVLAQAHPGVRFDDDSTEAVYVLDFTRCPAPAPPVGQAPVGLAPVGLAPVTQAPAAQAPVLQDAPPPPPTVAVAAGPVSATPPSAGAERLADTGAQAWQAAALAGVLLLGGTGMLAAGRRG